MKAPALLAVFSTITVGALALTDSARVTSHAGLRHLGFGRPFDWLVQDQSSLDPPSYPRDHGFISPWEYPATIHWVPLLVSLMVVFVTLAAVWLTWRRWSRRTRGSDALRLGDSSRTPRHVSGCTSRVCIAAPDRGQGPESQSPSTWT